MTTHTKMPENDAAHNDLVTVSAVIGDGESAHRIARVGGWTFTVPGVEGTEPEIPDTVLAERLSLRLDKLRALSDRHETAGNISPRRVTPTVGETSPRGGRPGVQRLYVEADALFLVTRSETPKAVALTREMIRVYMAVRRGLVPPPPAAQSVDPALLAAVLRQVVEMQASVEHLRGALAASATGPAIGYHVARSNILFPLRRIAARLAFVDPVRRYRQWLAHMHKELRQRLNRGISMPYGLMPVAALPEALGYLREREAEADLRERHGAKSQPSLFPAAKN